MSEIIIAIVSIVGMAIGSVVGYFIRKQVAQARSNTIESIAEKRITEAKNKEQELLLGAKEKAIKIIDEAKIEENARRQEIKKLQERVEQRENMFDKKLMEFEDRKTKLQQKVDEIHAIKEKIERAREQAVEQLQIVAGYTKEQAMEELFEKIEKTAGDDLMARTLKFEQVNSEKLEEKSREILITCMQRTACNHAAETTSTVVNLPSDEMKGRIIGKEGRNIKTIEKITGCELLIDETPDVILISSFSPIRRRVCHLALEKLIKDGRIQPAKIEEYVEEAKKDLAIDIRKAGEEAFYKMSIAGGYPKLMSIMGRLKYRTSYSQNVLLHSLEVGHIAGLIATEVGGVDPALARKAGFFHDVGKAVDHDTQGTHTEIGYTILKKFNIDENIAQVALTHHDTNPPLLLTKIVMAADAISASRTGARRDTFEEYVARLEELEKTAKDFPGVEKVFAIQAGREIRVFVNSSEIDDYASYNLAKDIAHKIEGELTYPGEIKVNVIRETRVVEYAR
ncbi:MAG: ribonuclease Y [bacterium]|nr:ribonuclease Y [bacterium]